MKDTKEQTEAPTNETSEKTIRWQQRWAGWLQRQSERLSKRSKITLWFVCCMGCGAYCSYLVIGGFSGSAHQSISFSQIKMPFYIGRTDKRVNARITEKEYKRVLGYMDYLDSLKKTEKGRELYDSIQHQRPGLSDSLQMVYKAYLDQ